LHTDSLEFFGPKHGHQQVPEQQESNKAHDDILHRFLLQFFAKAHVKTAHDKENDDNTDEDQVIHESSPASPGSSRQPIRTANKTPSSFGPNRAHSCQHCAAEPRPAIIKMEWAGVKNSLKKSRIKVLPPRLTVDFRRWGFVRSPFADPGSVNP
jgi:hypothetical protein